MKKLWGILSILVLIMVSCTSKTWSVYPTTTSILVSTTRTSTPKNTTVPILTPTIMVSLTLTMTPSIPTINVKPTQTLTLLQTLVPPVEKIEPDNAEKVSQVGLLQRDCSAIAWSPDGKLLAIGINMDGVHIYDAISFNEIAYYETVSSAPMMAFSPDGTKLALNQDFKVFLYQISSNRWIWNNTFGGTGFPFSLVFSHDGSLLAASGTLEQISLINPEDGSLVRTLQGPTWDIFEHDRMQDSILEVAFSPDDSILYSGSFDGTLELWRIKDGKLMKKLNLPQAKPAKGLAISSNGRLLAMNMGKSIGLFDTSTLSVIRNLVGHTNDIENLNFSPDGSILASGANDKTIRLWDVQTGKLLKTFTVNKSVLLGSNLAFSPDGTRLVTCSIDKTVRIWQVVPGNGNVEDLLSATP